MAIVSTDEALSVMKRCQRGTSNYDAANNLHAECYGTIGALVQERDRLRNDLEALAHQWSKRSDMAHPSDAMLINMHMRELRAALAEKGE